MVKQKDTLLLIAAAVAIAWMWRSRCGAETFTTFEAKVPWRKAMMLRRRAKRRAASLLLAKHVCAKTGFIRSGPSVNGSCPPGEILGPRGNNCGRCA